MRQCFSDRHPRGILFSILNRECDGYPDTRSCHCQRSVCLRNPETTCRLALGVLMRTIHFIQSFPSFRKLALRDRLVLVEKRWVPLFLLGLAQEHVTFEMLLDRGAQQRWQDCRRRHILTPQITARSQTCCSWPALYRWRPKAW
ncbi:hypothetical protein cypCar_00045800 [Cyprinus carpio]|nr:hypothetical protein cypCar_00045800 [Cyprinus carpio]